MRIGLSLSEPSPGGDVLGALTTSIRQAADDGFASGWLANIFGLDALTALAVAGSRVPGIELGTAVVPTYPRHPAALAQQALTVQAALDGRLALGIGLSHQLVIEGMYGLSFDKPARHMREYLEILLRCSRPARCPSRGRRSRRGWAWPAPATSACPCTWRPWRPGCCTSPAPSPRGPSSG
jgi:alkanesulfonate monooxygenase SsuD/methylene tetrahydromethanopterin reductase-like flavin-dependent oxidoreductase (luciferase family)